MPSRKVKDDPWWFPPTLTFFDVIPNAKVLRQFNHAILQRVIYEFSQVLYPKRPRRAKNDWVEPVTVDGARYILSLSIDEINRKVVITNIRPPKMMRKGRHK